MKIAFATQDLKRVDAHFGWAKNIAIYEIGPQGHRFLEAVQFEGDLKEDGRRQQWRTHRARQLHERWL